MTPSKPDAAKPSSSGDPEVGDPVAALSTALSNAGYGVGQQQDLNRLTAALAEQGYVLVNQKELEAALHKVRFCANWTPGFEMTAALHRKGHADEAAAILAAIQEQER